MLDPDQYAPGVEFSLHGQALVSSGVIRDTTQSEHLIVSEPGGLVSGLVPRSVVSEEGEVPGDVTDASVATDPDATPPAPPTQ